MPTVGPGRIGLWKQSSQYWLAVAKPEAACWNWLIKYIGSRVPRSFPQSLLSSSLAWNNSRTQSPQQFGPFLGLEFIWIFWSVVVLQTPNQKSKEKFSKKFHYPRVSPSDQLLTEKIKKTSVTSVKIMGLRLAWNRLYQVEIRSS